jgi:hypothetical protein
LLICDSMASIDARHHRRCGIPPGCPSMQLGSREAILFMAKKRFNPRPVIRTDPCEPTTHCGCDRLSCSERPQCFFLIARTEMGSGGPLSPKRCFFLNAIRR